MKEKQRFSWRKTTAGLAGAAILSLTAVSYMPEPIEVQGASETPVVKADDIVPEVIDQSSVTPVVPIDENGTSHYGVEEDFDAADISIEIGKFNQELMKIVNQERSRVGVSSLAYNGELQKGANVRVNDLVQMGDLSSDHRRPDGSSWDTAFAYLEDGNTSASGENISFNSYRPEDILMAQASPGGLEQRLAKDLYTLYENSPSHYKNMISGYHDYIASGLAFVDSDYGQIRVYNAMNFSVDLDY